KDLPEDLYEPPPQRLEAGPRTQGWVEVAIIETGQGRGKEGAPTESQRRAFAEYVKEEAAIGERVTAAVYEEYRRARARLDEGFADLVAPAIEDASGLTYLIELRSVVVHAPDAKG